MRISPKVQMASKIQKNQPMHPRFLMVVWLTACTVTCSLPQRGQYTMAPSFFIVLPAALRPRPGAFTLAQRWKKCKGGRRVFPPPRKCSQFVH